MTQCGTVPTAGGTVGGVGLLLFVCVWCELSSLVLACLGAGWAVVEEGGGGAGRGGKGVVLVLLVLVLVSDGRSDGWKWRGEGWRGAGNGFDCVTR